jgi:hypothetical protein
MADDDIQRFAYDNAVFHDIVQHYDDTARGNHDDIDFDAASLDDVDGTEYDNNGHLVIVIDAEFLAALSHIVIATHEYDGFDNIPDDYDFASDETFGDDCGFWPTRERFYRCDSTRNDDDLPAD